MINFLIANNLLTPLVQIVAALIALFAVILTQLFLHYRSKKEIEAKFQMLEKEQQYKKESEKRKERLLKIEEVFSLIQELRDETESTFTAYTKIVEKDLRTKETNKALLDAHEKLVKFSCPRRLMVQLLISIYIPELKNFAEKWTDIEQQLTSCRVVLSTKIELSTSPEFVECEYLRGMYIKLLQYFDQSVEELSGYANKF